MLPMASVSPSTARAAHSTVPLNHTYSMDSGRVVSAELLRYSVLPQEDVKPEVRGAVTRVSLWV